MNKKHKILFSLCAVFVFAFSFFLVNFQPLYVNADSTPSTHSVSFIAPDNSLLYSTDNYVPTGYSLQELEDDNILLNSYFGNYNYTGGVYTFSNWSTVGTSTILTKAFNGVNVSFSNQYARFYQFFDLSSLIGETVTFSAKISNLNNLRNNLFILIHQNVPGTPSYDESIAIRIDNNGIFSCTGTIRSDATSAYVAFYTWSQGTATTSFDVEYVKLEKSSLFTGYFNHSLVDDLLSGYDTADYIYSYDIDYSQAITSDMYFYPIYNYEAGFIDGMNYANNFYEGFGIFKYATYSFVKRTDYSYIYNDFTGRFTTTYFDYYNGGFTINSTLFHLVDDYCFNNEIDDIVMKIDFDNPVDIGKYSFYTFYDFQFGNSVKFILSNGVTLSYDYSDLSSSALSLVEYDSLSINSIIVGFASSFGDYGQIGISCNSNYTYSYNKGFYDGYNSGNTDGYNSGYRIGERSGYDTGYRKGVDDSGDYTFFGLISAVIDAPIQVLTGLFNFEFLGINLWSFFTGLFTLALIILIVKFVLGGR